jgi:hypothetical protein
MDAAKIHPTAELSFQLFKNGIAIVKKIISAILQHPLHIC